MYWNAYISQLSRLRSLVLGRMNKECPHCHALHWIDESWEPCCKRGSVQLQLLPDSPQCLKDLLVRTNTQGRHFKDNLRQYNAAFAFTSLDYDIVSTEDRANNGNNRGGLNVFQTHGALCHRQGPLLSVEGIVPSYTQLYIYVPSYDAQRRPERNEDLDNEMIENLSTLLSQCKPFARIYRYAYEILSNHESPSISGEDRVNNNGSAESGLPYIIINSSMRMHLIEEDDKRAHNLSTMEEVVAVIPIEFIDKNFRDIVLTLRSSNSNDSLRQRRDFE